MAVTLVVVTLGVGSAPAQDGGWADLHAGGELDRYLRYLQSLGLVPAYPWGARAFSAVELERLAPPDTGHPWAGRYRFRGAASGESVLSWVSPRASIRINTAFPYGYNDGPLWQGRGVTLALDGGFAARVGVLSASVAPSAFMAQNAAFRVLSNGQSGDLAYGDGTLWYAIDRPQRFGAGAYARLDPGQTMLRVDWRSVAIGVSTANQFWGPATEFPVILGNNAAGFPHLFVGTARPVDLWLVKIHGRLLWGRLTQSAFAAETASGGVRLGTGLVAVIVPRGLPGLELGVTRFSHRPWPGQLPSLAYLLNMFRGRQGPGEVNSPSENQLASAFFRWVLPRSGFEVYAEYGRDDYNLDLRDFIEEPDHIGGYTLGFRKAVPRAGHRLLAVRAEMQNLQFSRLSQGRAWVPFYTHAGVQQGHTQLGQVLGSEAGVGGAGSTVAVEAYSPSGRWTWSWTRLVRQHRGDFLFGGVEDPRALDVQHALTVERVAFRGRYDLWGRASLVYEFNRDFGSDALNLHLAIGVRAGMP